MKNAGLITHKVYIHLNMAVKRRGSLSVKTVNCTFVFLPDPQYVNHEIHCSKNVYINGALAQLKLNADPKLMV